MPLGWTLRPSGVVNLKPESCPALQDVPGQELASSHCTSLALAPPTPKQSFPRNKLFGLSHCPWVCFWGPA